MKGFDLAVAIGVLARAFESEAVRGKGDSGGRASGGGVGRTKGLAFTFVTAASVLPTETRFETAMILPVVSRARAASSRASAAATRCGLGIGGSGASGPAVAP